MSADVHDESREIARENVVGERCLPTSTGDDVAREVGTGLVARPERATDLVPPVDETEPVPRRELTQSFEVCLRPRALLRRADFDHTVQVRETAYLLLPHTGEDLALASGRAIRHALGVLPPRS